MSRAHHHHNAAPPVEVNEEPAAEPRPTPPAGDRGHLTLWLAVGGIMLVVLVLWLLLLPVQLGRIGLTSSGYLDRWHVLQPNAGKAGSLSDSLDRLHRKLEELTGKMESQSAAQPSLDLPLLRQKLDAASTQQANPTNESPK